MSRDFRSDRRAMLKAGGAVIVAGSFAGCTAGGQAGSANPTTGSGTTASDETTAGGTTTDAETTDGPTATVEVGPGGRLAFEPSGDRPLLVESGTTVEFVWRSDSHSVAVDRQPDEADWQGSPGGAGVVYDEGYEFGHTFEEPGVYAFHCEAHESVGMTGTIIVTGEGVTPEYATGDDLPVEVGANDELTFSPGTDRPLKVVTGTEVEFVWRSDDHNVVVQTRPDGADWGGTDGDPTTLYDEGHEHSHTFDVAGTYRFYCQAHRSAGMVGTIVVEESDEK